MACKRQKLTARTQGVVEKVLAANHEITSAPSPGFAQRAFFFDCRKNSTASTFAFQLKVVRSFFRKNTAVLQKFSGSNKGATQVLTPGDACIVS